jgi:hypothetical protein
LLDAPGLARMTLDLTEEQCPICYRATRHPGQLCDHCSDPYYGERGTVKRGQHKGRDRKIPAPHVGTIDHGCGQCETCGTFYVSDNYIPGHTATEAHKLMAWIRYQIASRRFIVRGKMARFLRVALAASWAGDRTATWVPHPAIALSLQVPDSVAEGVELLAIAEPIYRTLREHLIPTAIRAAMEAGTHSGRPAMCYDMIAAFTFTTTLRLAYPKAPLEYGRAFFSPLPSGAPTDDGLAVIRKWIAADLGEHYMHEAREAWIEGVGK